MTFSVPTTFNPSDKAASVTLSNRNLTVSTASIGIARTLTKVSSGKWYVEFIRTLDHTGWYFGLANATASLTNNVGQNVHSISLNAGSLIYNNSVVETVVGLNTFGAIGMAIDADARTVRFFNGTATSSARAIGLTGDIYIAAGNQYSSATFGTMTLNAGETPFTYSVPSGYTSGFALRTAYGIAGNVKDASGANAARTVRAFRRDTGAISHVTASDASTGNYLVVPFPNDNTTVHVIECLPVSTSEPALVLDRMVAG